MPIARSSRVTVAVCLWACLFTACHRRAPLKPYIAYVVNNQSATLAAVNLADFHVTASLRVPAGPEHVLLRPGTHQLYITSAHGQISVVDFPRLHVVATLGIGQSAAGLVFSTDGRHAYVLSPADHQVVFLDCQGAPGDRPDDTLPRVAFRLTIEGTLAASALSADGKTLVVASHDPDRLNLISTDTHRTLAAVEVGRQPGSLVILPDNSKAFVADTGDEKVSAVDIVARKLLSHIEIGMHPTLLLLKPDGGEIFAVAGQSASMAIVDAFHDNVEQTFPLGTNPVAGVFRQDMSVLYIANAGDGSVISLDPQNRIVLNSSHVGIQPWALALTPDERLLVVADRAASSLAVMYADPTSFTTNRSALITTIPVGASPVDVIVPNTLGQNR